jgi:hypothetical protein
MERPWVQGVWLLPVARRAGEQHYGCRECGYPLPPAAQTSRLQELEARGVRPSLAARCAGQLHCVRLLPSEIPLFGKYLHRIAVYSQLGIDFFKQA